MKNFLKSLLGTFYLSVILYFIGQSSLIWVDKFLFVPVTEDDIFQAERYTSYFLPVIPLIIWITSSFFHFVKKQKKEIVLGKIFSIFSIILICIMISIFIWMNFLTIDSPGKSIGAGLVYISIFLYGLPVYLIFCLYGIKKVYGFKWGICGFIVVFLGFFLSINIVFKCPSSKPLKGRDGICYSCDTPFAVGGDCSMCTKRGGRNCALKTCPNDKTLRDNFGNCFSCDTPYAINLEQGLDCSICTNRQVEMNSQKCALRTCPNDYPLRIQSGDCKACNNPSDFTVISNNCSVCPQRTLLDRRLYSCAITICPKDYPIRSEYACLSCKEATYCQDKRAECHASYEKFCIKK